MHRPSTLGFSILATVVALVSLAGPAQTAGPGPTPVTDGASILEVKFGCKLVGGKLVCGVDDNNTNKSGGSGEDTGKKKKKSGGNQGERSCPPGYIVLDKPNKYGAYCEPADASKSTPPKEAEKCKFGMLGTPPNCYCPEGQEFMGYKGCQYMRWDCVVKYREEGAGPEQVLTYQYYGVGTETQVRGKISEDMDLRHYQQIGPVNCKKVQ